MSLALHQLAKKALEAAEKAQKTADDAQQAIVVMSAELAILKEKEKQSGPRRISLPNR